PMRSLRDLKTFAGEAATLLARDKDLAGWELYCSSAAHRVVRLNYTSDIPSRGIEEFKSLNADGFALRIVTRHDRHETGAATIAGDFSPAAVKDALTRARAAVVIDPHFSGLAADSHELDAPPPPNDLVKTGDDLLASGAWRIIAGALETFERSAPLKLARPGLI